jgi:single-strand DNA-binding protein
MFAQITIVGNVGQDPELRQTQGGVPVCNFSVAVNRTWTDGTGEQQQKVTWFRIAAWRKQAEACHKYLKKGDRVLVVSEIVDVTAWIDQAGTARGNIEVVPRTIRFLTSKPGEAETFEDVAEAATNGKSANEENPFF